MNDLVLPGGWHLRKGWSGNKSISIGDSASSLHMETRASAKGYERRTLLVSPKVVPALVVLDDLRDLDVAIELFEFTQQVCRVGWRRRERVDELLRLARDGRSTCVGGKGRSAPGNSPIRVVAILHPYQSSCPRTVVDLSWRADEVGL